MIRREKREHVRTSMDIAEVVCDRCGEPLDRIMGLGVPSDWNVKGGYFRGERYPSQNADDHQRVEAELCATCTDDLVEWIAEGDGAGARVQTAKQMSDAMQEEFRRADA